MVASGKPRWPRLGHAHLVSSLHPGERVTLGTALGERVTSGTALGEQCTRLSFGTWDQLGSSRGSPGRGVTLITWPGLTVTQVGAHDEGPATGFFCTDAFLCVQVATE